MASPSGYDPRDGAFDEIVDEAEKLIAAGGIVYQKFTCARCGQRLSMERPNTFYRTGSCDKCDHVTDLLERGCGFRLIAGLSAPAMEALRRAAAAQQAEIDVAEFGGDAGELGRGRP